MSGLDYALFRIWLLCQRTKIKKIISSALGTLNVISQQTKIMGLFLELFYSYGFWTSPKKKKSSKSIAFFNETFLMWLWAQSFTEGKCNFTQDMNRSFSVKSFSRKFSWNWFHGKTTFANVLMEICHKIK